MENRCHLSQQHLVANQLLQQPDLTQLLQQPDLTQLLQQPNLTQLLQQLVHLNLLFQRLHVPVDLTHDLLLQQLQLINLAQVHLIQLLQGH